MATDWAPRYRQEIQQMMFVSGETGEPSAETTALVEQIVRRQVIDLLVRSTALAARRGVKSVATDDLIFLIRHDKAKVSRLKTFLSWKDVRKNVKDSDDKGGADAADFAAGDDALAGTVAGPTDVASKPKNKRAKIRLPWDLNNLYPIQAPEREDEDDNEEEEQNHATMQRLITADERTKGMTREEYVFFSECRQASFTFRKAKRFREWAGFGVVTDSKPNDDIVDILGFLTFEVVQRLTEEAIRIKEQEDRDKKNLGEAEDEDGTNSKKRKRETGLFDPPQEGRTPVEPRHIREAYRRLQTTPHRSVAMLLGDQRARMRMPPKII
ncbi:diphthine synthase [Ascosphaera pollenicola]|nr:diphthine synthase [Ascosphaera pollenicola]